MFDRVKRLFRFGAIFGAGASILASLAGPSKPYETPRWREIEQRIRAKYDAALTNDSNARHWSKVDYLSARAANDFGTRRTLRVRAGYEISNNPYARGIVNRRAAYLIGRGPRLQVKYPNEQDNLWVQRAWAQWCAATQYHSTLRMMAIAKGGRDGEGIALLKTNPRVADQVKLYVQPIEADQCMTPTPGYVDDGTWVDGIELDEFGNPAVYHILRNHPGDRGPIIPQMFDRIPSRYVLHWLRKDRPGQVRGVPEITPGLDLFAHLRRWTNATILNCELVAAYALFIETNGLADSAQIDAMTQEFLQHVTVTALPKGWKPFQVDPKQPTTAFAEFEHAILVQVCSALDIPFGIAIGDFSRSSYASGRLDVQGFTKTMQIERGGCIESCVEPTFNEWLLEGSRIPGYLPEVARRQAFAMDRRIASDVPHLWRWDAPSFIDIKKEVDAYAAAVNSNFVTRHFVAAELFGLDWDDVVVERGAEAKAEDKNGVQVALPGSPIVPLDKQKDEVDQQILEETTAV